MDEALAERQAACPERRPASAEHPEAASDGVDRLLGGGSHRRITLRQRQRATHATAVPPARLQRDGGPEGALLETHRADGIHHDERSGARPGRSPTGVDGRTDQKLVEMLERPTLLGGHRQRLHPGTAPIDVARQCCEGARHHCRRGRGDGQERRRGRGDRRLDTGVPAGLSRAPPHPEATSDLLVPRIGAHQQHSARRDGVDGGDQRSSNGRGRLADGDDGHLSGGHHLGGLSLAQPGSPVATDRSRHRDQQHETQQHEHLQQHCRNEEEPVNLPAGSKFERDSNDAGRTGQETEEASHPWTTQRHTIVLCSLLQTTVRRRG